MLTQFRLVRCQQRPAVIVNRKNRDPLRLELPKKGSIEKIFKFRLIEKRDYSEQITNFSIQHLILFSDTQSVLLEGAGRKTPTETASKLNRDKERVRAILCTSKRIVHLPKNPKPVFSLILSSPLPPHSPSHPSDQDPNIFVERKIECNTYSLLHSSLLRSSGQRWVVWPVADNFSRASTFSSMTKFPIFS